MFFEIHEIILQILLSLSLMLKERLQNLGRHIVENHYENLPMQYTEIFKAIKNENFQQENLIFFLFLLKT